LVEGATAVQIEARMMPVAGENAVLDGAAIEWEAHMGASIVDCENFTGAVENRDDVITEDYGEVSFAFQLGERCGGNPARRCFA